jgi:hypothetical protein
MMAGAQPSFLMGAMHFTICQLYVSTGTKNFYWVLAP